MAPRLKDKGNGSGDVTQQHNAKHRATVIKQSIQRLYAIDEEIASIIANSEIGELRQEKSDIKKNLRESFQMPAPLVQARYYSYRVEKRAQQTGDDVTLDAIREMYKILPVGGMVDLMAVAEGKPQPEPTTKVRGKGKRTTAELLPQAGRGAAAGPEEEEEQEEEGENAGSNGGEPVNDPPGVEEPASSAAYTEGYQAGQIGSKDTFNPFTGKQKAEWLNGWKAGRKRAIETQGEAVH